MRNKRILGLVPARGGSKGILKKNIKEFCGKPLVAWTIEAALGSSYITDVVVSTDDLAIAEISLMFGAQAPFLRPSELSKDETLRNEVIRHALGLLGDFDYVVLLQPTSPLRTSRHIDEAILLTYHKNAATCVSVVEQHPSPHWMYSVSDNGFIQPVLQGVHYQRRQSLPNYYSLNGAIFISETDHFLTSEHHDPFITDETIPYVMEHMSSIDIDTHIDWQFAELLKKTSEEKQAD